jgi:coenzyme F420-reducing hydrogenase gamma subunit
MALIDLGKDFLALLEYVDIAKHRLIEERKDKKNNLYDICFIEGSPLYKDNIEALKDLRKRSKVIVVLGGCADSGCVYALRNYTNKEKAARHVYPKSSKTIFNPAVAGISSVITIDYVLPGCPVTANEFIDFVTQVIGRGDYKREERPICYECKKKNNPCLLQQGLPCLGPCMQGGCEAVCPSAGMPCQGCRGPLPDAQWDNMEKKLKELLPAKKVNEILEIFGEKERVKSKSRITKTRN